MEAISFRARETILANLYTRKAIRAPLTGAIRQSVLLQQQDQH